MDGGKINHKDNKKSIYSHVRKRLLVIFLVLDIAITLVNSTVIARLCIERSVEDANKMAGHVASEMSEYKAIGGLVEYWHDHADEMELVYEEPRIDAMEGAFRAENMGIGKLSSITEDGFDKLTEEARKQYAEICHGRLSVEFDGMKTDFDPLFLSSFIVKDGV